MRVIGEIMIEEINEILDARGTGFTVQSIIVHKPEGDLHGLTLKSKDSNVSTTIYEQFPEYMSADEIADRLIDLYERVKTPTMDITCYLNKEYIHNNVLPRLVNKKYKDQLDKNNTFYIHWLDLLVMYYITIPDFSNEESTASLTLTFDSLKAANVDAPSICEIAVKNLENKVVYKSITEMLKEMTALRMDEDPIGSPKMYVFTNTKMIQGSAVMLTNTFLEKVQMLFGDNATIIPSSVHELIVVENPQGLDLASMIKEENETQITASEYLGDYPYEYVDGKIFCREDLGDPIEKDIL